MRIIKINSFKLNKFTSELNNYKTKLNKFNAELNNLKIDLSEIVAINWALKHLGPNLRFVFNFATLETR